jgi:hypothetical protein
MNARAGKALVRQIGRTGGAGKRTGSGFSHDKQIIPQPPGYSTVGGYARGFPRGDGDLENPIALMREQIVGFLDLVELEAMRDERAKINPARTDYAHQSPHALLAPWAQGAHNGNVPEPGVERFERHGQLPRVYAEAGKHASRAENLQTELKRILRPQRLDGDVDATTGREPHDCGDRVLRGVVDHNLGAEQARDLCASGHTLDREDAGRALETRSRGGAESDRPQRCLLYKNTSPRD